MTVQMQQGDGYRLGFSTEGRPDRRIVRFGVHPLGVEKQFKASQQFQQEATQRGVKGVLTIPSFSRPNRDFGYALEGFDTDLYFLRTVQPALLRGPAMADLLLRALAVLLDVREKCGRTHGGFRPGAVLLALSPDRTRLADLALTDFAPCEEAQCGLFKEPDLVKFEPDDVEAFGKIIAQFVTGRLGVKGARDPEVPEPESEPARWLEADYERWRALASDLDKGKVGDLHALGRRLHALAAPGTQKPEILARARTPFRPGGTRVVPPAVTLPPADVRLERGQPLTIEAQVEGSAPLECQWFKNGSPLGNQTTSSLLVPSSAESDSGQYTLEVKNAAGKAISGVVTLRVGLRPQISTEPAQQVVPAGSKVRLAVLVEGTAPLQLQWSKDGTTLPGATQAEFLIDRARETDTGAYVLKASNPWGEAVGGTITLQVAVAPRITREPDDLASRAGDPVEFRFEHEGTPPLQYRWRRNGRDLPGQTQPFLRLAAARVADSGSYDVVIANAVGEVTSRAAVLTVAGPPAITEEPQDQMVKLGAPIRLVAGTGGTAPLSHEWRKDGQPIPGATQPSLLIRAAKTEDAGNYDLIVRNPGGTVTTRKARVQVAVPPQITAEPEDRSVGAGEAVQFGVEAEGTGPLRYQWRRNKRALPGQTSGRLELAAVGVADGGTYDVVITNEVGEVASRGAVLTVAGPPAFTSQPGSQTIRVGSPLRLAAIVEGTEPLSYQWRKDGLAIPGATRSSFEVAAVEASAAGEYDLLVRNAGGTVTSEKARVQVAYPPRITRSPQSCGVRAGDPIECRVEAEGTEPLEYQWFNGDQPLPGQHAASLRLAAVRTADRGEYRVTVRNLVGESTSARFTLTVGEPPEIVEPPRDQTLKSGTAVRFTASATGSPPLRFEWRKDGAVIPGEDSATLEIPAATDLDAGRYQVRVQNEWGGALSQEAILRLAEPPLITHEPGDQTIIASQSAEFTVEATGTPPFRYQWSRDGGALEGKTDSTLTLTAVQPADAGEYRVTVRNAVGEATSRKAVLKVVGPPQITSQPRVPRARAGGRARLSVAAEGTEPLHYQWRKDGADLPEGTTPDLELEPLTAQQAGAYDVVVSNRYGWVASEPVALVVRRPFPWRTVTITSVCLAALLGGFGWYWRVTHEPGAIRFAEGRHLLDTREPGLALQAFSDVRPSSARYGEAVAQVRQLTSLPEISVTQHADRAEMTPDRLEVSFFDAEAGRADFSLPFQIKENFGRAWKPGLSGTEGPLTLVATGPDSFSLALANQLVAAAATNTLQFTWDTGAGTVVQTHLTLVLRRLVNEPPSVQITGLSTPPEVGQRFTLTAQAKDSTLPLGQQLTYRWQVSPTNGISLLPSGTSNIVVECSAPREFTFTVVVRDGGGLESSNRLAITIAPSQVEQREEELRAISNSVGASRLDQALERLRTNRLPDELKSSLTSGLTRTNWTIVLGPSPATLVQGTSNQIKVAPFATTTTSRVDAILGRVPWVVAATNDVSSGIEYVFATNRFRAGEGLTFWVRAGPEARMGQHVHTLIFSNSLVTISARLPVRIDQSAQSRQKDQQAAVKRDLAQADSLIEAGEVRKAAQLLAKYPDNEVAKARLADLSTAPYLANTLRQPVELEFNSKPDLFALLRTNLASKVPRSSTAWVIKAAETTPWREGLFTNRLEVTDREGVAASNVISVAFLGTANAAMRELNTATAELGDTNASLANVLATLTALETRRAELPSAYQDRLTDRLHRLRQPFDLVVPPTLTTSVLAGETNELTLQVRDWPNDFKLTPGWGLEFASNDPLPDRPLLNGLRASYTPPRDSPTRERSFALRAVGAGGGITSHVAKLTFNVRQNHPPQFAQLPTPDPVEVTGPEWQHTIQVSDEDKLTVPPEVYYVRNGTTSRVPPDPDGKSFRLQISNLSDGLNLITLGASDGVHSSNHVIRINYTLPAPFEKVFELTKVQLTSRTAWVGANLVTWEELKRFDEKFPNRLPLRLAGTGQVKLRQDDARRLLQALASVAPSVPHVASAGVCSTSEIKELFEQRGRLNVSFSSDETETEWLQDAQFYREGHKFPLSTSGRVPPPCGLRLLVRTSP